MNQKILIIKFTHVFILMTESTSMVQSRKIYNNNYMIALIQITKMENFLLIDVPVFNFLRHNVLFINRKEIRTC